MDGSKIRVAVLALLAFLLVNLPAVLAAQELIFENHPGTWNRNPNYGPNKTHFLHPYLAAAMSLPCSAPGYLATSLPFSGEIGLGYRYKLKVSRRLALVAEAGFSRYQLLLEQNQGKTFPDSVIHRNQSILSNDLHGGFFIRIRIGQNGDYLGNFIDLGMTGLVPLVNSIKTSDLRMTGNPGKVTALVVTRSGFDGLQATAAGASVRIGFDRFCVTVSRRLTRWMKTPGESDLPVWQTGVEFAPFRY
jgi:hypothetical protein